ncbi:hypothetical protein PF005_g4663 [Phytophthora fragariae]|uniref:Secreted protein n=1 Tax=Phytophthora fragariae TaxID=53985 RepID=A0A6A3DT11_9STRA|nr:hypothetical protein PF003_g20682 [Phytophthora fragariae]KAE8922947.1 hypothetical protein PF009_g26795 [Phytophthora fragariae]KAE8972117.1 hypothetical protein PF011_g25766 [Phytophthora fragariae]KAE9067847.1 hypothetical protein PF010_g27298 [Phytophthora fragariae]KAE9073391.1 hypothetical protein PF007_g25819 [Phytophthora fragariae]
MGAVLVQISTGLCKLILALCTTGGINNGVRSAMRSCSLRLCVMRGCSDGPGKMPLRFEPTCSFLFALRS